MSKSRYIDTHFWKDNYIIELDPSEKLLFLYLLTNPNTSISGIYELNIRQIAFDTGFDREMIIKIINRFERDGKVWYKNGWVILKNFVKHQRLNPSIKLGIKRNLAELPAFLAELVILHEDDEKSTYFIEVKVQLDDRLGTDCIDSDTYSNINTNSNLNINRNSNNNPKPPELPVVGVDENSVSKTAERVSSKTIDGMFEYWEKVVGYGITAKVKQNRDACGKLSRDYTREEIALMIQAASLASEDQYAPGVANFIDLYNKWDALKLWGKKKGIRNATATFG